MNTPARVEITVTHLVDDSVRTVTLTGTRRSSQLWDGGRALITVFDADGRRTEVWQGSQVQIIHTRWLDTPPEETR